MSKSTTAAHGSPSISPDHPVHADVPGNSAAILQRKCDANSTAKNKLAPTSLRGKSRCPNKSRLVNAQALRQRRLLCPLRRTPPSRRPVAQRLDLLVFYEDRVRPEPVPARSVRSTNSEFPTLLKSGCVLVSSGVFFHCACCQSYISQTCFPPSCNPDTDSSPEARCAPLPRIRTYTYPHTQRSYSRRIPRQATPPTPETPTENRDRHIVALRALVFCHVAQLHHRHLLPHELGKRITGNVRIADHDAEADPLFVLSGQGERRLPEFTRVKSSWPLSGHPSNSLARRVSSQWELRAAPPVLPPGSFRLLSASRPRRRGMSPVPCRGCDTTSGDGVSSHDHVQLGYKSAGKGPWFSRFCTAGPAPKSYLSKLCGGTYAAAVPPNPAFMKSRRRILLACLFRTGIANQTACDAECFRERWR